MGFVRRPEHRWLPLWQRPWLRSLLAAKSPPWRLPQRAIATCSLLLALHFGFATNAASAERTSPETRAAALVARMSREEKISQLVNAAPAIPRLHIPAYEWWNEGLHGLARNGHATVFPQAIGMAAT